jgi:3-oxoacyl-(acyl-carrier-protein) synthase/SAM-dependent methyltransferase/acyl carrier protein
VSGGESMREPVAILGLALRLPGGVSTPERFWTALAEGEDLIGTVPPERWDAASFQSPDPDEPGTTYDVHGGFISDVDAFDANFFGMHSREASRADPQQRLLLELTWEALERSSINPQSLARSRTGIWIGISNVDWTRMLLEEPRKIDGYTGTGAAGSVAAGRIAHFLGTWGPAEVIDTACSSSLVAVHHAVQSLRRGETNLAIAGGANLILSPELHICFSRTGMLSRSGRCHTFDDAADGYVRAEACCVIVLKRLSDARRDGDPVLAVVHGTAVNQDGRSARLTAPNVRAQQDVMRSALADAGLAPGAVSCVEAHGTGTPLGDPMEFLSIGAVYGSGRSPARPLRIGSVKTNLGHAEGAAGLTGLIKVVLELQPGHSIAPHLHCSSPSSRIDWQRWPIEVPGALTPWTEEEGPRFAGVSSFGFSGTNAHAIVGSVDAVHDAAPAVHESAPGEPLLCLSAADPQALRMLAGSYAAFLRETAENFVDICDSVLATRARLPYRLVVKACGSSAAAESLEQWLAGNPASGVITGPGETPDALRVHETTDPLAKDFLSGEKLQIAPLSGRRVPLPLYPFQRQRFWFGEAPEVQRRSERKQVWQDMAAEAARASQRGPLGWKPESYSHRWTALERLTLAYARNVLFHAGAFPTGKAVTAGEVMQNCAFQPTYHRLIGRWLRNLAREGVLFERDERYWPGNGWAPVALEGYWRDAECALAADPGMLAYFRRCGDLLEDVLTGRMSPLETLFPGGSFDFAEALYRQASEARYSNAMAADALRTAVQGWGEKRNVRILEVGAGTGGTTSAVISRLPADQTEYWFTDVSELFLRRARQNFGQYSFVRYARFDLDREPEEQNIPLGRFDVVIAANAVHATRNLHSSLGRIHRLLAPGGVLLLIETTTHQTCFDMSIGLIEGWQHFEDDARGEHPLLDAERWRELLAKNGFEQSISLPENDSPASGVGQHVILAQRNLGTAREHLDLLAGQRATQNRERDHAGVSAVERPEQTGVERAEWVRGVVRQTICRVFQLQIGADELSDRDRLSDLGMDSLIALELRGELSKALGLEGKVSATVAFDTGTVGELTRLLMDLLAAEKQIFSRGDGSENRAVADSVAITPEALREMTDAEVEVLLKERLAER